MIVLVTYDLKSPSTEYGPLYEYLKSHKGWSHYLEDTWLISTDQSAKTVSQKLITLIKPDDRFLVVRLDKDRGGWLPRAAWDWIHKHE